MTQSYHITPLMSKRGNPYNNTLTEIFFSILKAKCIYRVQLQTYDARFLINEIYTFTITKDYNQKN